MGASTRPELCGWVSAALSARPPSALSAPLLLPGGPPRFELCPPPRGLLPGRRERSVPALAVPCREDGGAGSASAPRPRSSGAARG